MTSNEKRQFINDLVDTVLQNIFVRFEQLPPEWEGHELREYVKDQFAQVVWRPMDRAHRLAYNRAILEKNL